MYTTLSGQLAVTKQIELIANNLANANTTGFKSERPIFEKALVKQDVMLSNSLKSDIQKPNALMTNDFTSLRGSYSDFSQGSLEMTNNPLDLAIEGRGFFVVQSDAGERFTRAGSFRLDEQGRLVTQSGLPVLGQGGEITIADSGQVTVAKDGTIKVNNQAVGKLRVVDLASSDAIREPGQLFALKEGGATSEIESPNIASGSIESSNVNAVRELADMILASRLFESFKEAQASSSKMSELSTGKLGSTQG